MRTARALTVSRRMLCSGGWGLVPRGGRSGPRGRLVPEWVWSQRGVWSQGVSCDLQGILGYHPPLWTEWQTGIKILPCPKLRLRAVMKSLGLILVSLYNYANFDYVLCIQVLFRQDINDPFNTFKIINFVKEIATWIKIIGIQDFAKNRVFPGLYKSM